MLKKPVFFVAFEEQDNLGIGYISSVLLQAGFDIKIIDFRLGGLEILEELRRDNPLIVGYSIIFQYHIGDFRNLIRFLRKQGINSHFCAGGHYPSLRYKEIMDAIPELDSVVLFEGEKTFLELVQSIYDGKDWRYIKGIAYRNNNSIEANPLQRLENDLDNFPPPARRSLKEFALGKKYATILAGRGCVHNCSFCSIREFYSRPPGRIKRIRRPEMVVREMELLHEQMNCSIFAFQDDDFPVASKGGKEWVQEFCRLLAEKGLSEEILWKISCRPDEVEEEIFTLMRNHGLFLVYLGIEAGSNDSLLLMNKRISAETNINAVNILKRLEILFDFGFMLFDPSTTYRSIAENLDFLESICGDGSSPVTFCKMLPYAETKIERMLKSEGRLRGEQGFEDYDFKDISLNHYHDFLVDCFGVWIYEHDGLLNLARWARYYWAVYKKYFLPTPYLEDSYQTIHEVISRSNLYFIDTARRLSALFKKCDSWYDTDAFRNLKEEVTNYHRNYKEKINDVVSNMEKLVRND